MKSRREKRSNREMQLRVVVEHIVSGKLVQLSQHAQPVVSLTFFIRDGNRSDSFSSIRKKESFQSSWCIQPGHGGACKRRFPTLCAGFPRLAVGKPKTTALFST